MIFNSAFLHLSLVCATLKVHNYCIIRDFTHKLHLFRHFSLVLQFKKYGVKYHNNVALIFYKVEYVVIEKYSITIIFYIGNEPLKLLSTNHLKMVVLLFRLWMKKWEIVFANWTVIGRTATNWRDRPAFRDLRRRF